MPNFKRNHKKRQYNKKPNTNESFYSSNKWKKYSVMLRHQQIFCAACIEETFIGKGSRGALDHVIPLVKGGSRWNEDNLIGLCLSCHATKTFLDKLKSSPLIPYIRREDGLVPLNKQMIVDVIRAAF